MNEAVVCVKKNDGTLRGRRAPAHLPCKDRGVNKGSSGVPVCVPGDFTVRLGGVDAGGGVNDGEAGGSFDY